MDPIIRIKDYQLKEIMKMLAPDEQLFVAVNHGKPQPEQGKAWRADEVDYLLLTDKRIIDIKGRFFRDRIGFNAYPRRLVTGADFRHFLVGCTITVRFRDERDEESEIEIQFQNCGKPESETMVKLLTDQIELRMCPKCMRRLKEDHTFCPMCGAPLKRLCPSCGKQVNTEEAICHHCGC
ncbi:MAG: zinc ribbon domain-containing protein [bacterium]